MSSLFTRVVSALFGLALILGVYWIWGNKGLFVFSTCAVFRVGYEFGRLVFEKSSFALVFGAIITSLFVGHYAFPSHFLIYYTLVSASVLASLTWLTNQGLSLSRVAQIQASTALGFFYCTLLPIHVVNIIYVGPNAFWFPVFLCIVFACDTFAYFVGLQWGKRRLLEPVSPKKSVEGAIGGVGGSLLVGAAVSLMFDVPLGPMLVISFATAVLSQMGDLFESLLKRVANVKDSGRFMPGHGGLMDRLDGVYLSAPL
ncbi:MAG TPA: phosphatidate cytidylyltransferase, partial [Bdellovibrionales bacterium]|nr:phosphatidate cytidylyltransferase [Bdellovibrionales bacterium]